MHGWSHRDISLFTQGNAKWGLCIFFPYNNKSDIILFAAFKKEDKLVDLRLKNLKKETLLKNDGPLMNVSFDPSRKSDYVRIAVGHEDGIVSIHQVDHGNIQTN